MTAHPKPLLPNDATHLFKLWLDAVCPNEENTLWTGRPGVSKVRDHICIWDSFGAFIELHTENPWYDVWKYILSLRHSDIKLGVCAIEATVLFLRGRMAKTKIPYDSTTGYLWTFGRIRSPDDLPGTPLT